MLDLEPVKENNKTLDLQPIEDNNATLDLEPIEAGALQGGVEQKRFINRDVNLQSIPVNAMKDLGDITTGIAGLIGGAVNAGVVTPIKRAVAGEPIIQKQDFTNAWETAKQLPSALKQGLKEDYGQANIDMFSPSGVKLDLTGLAQSFAAHPLNRALDVLSLGTIGAGKRLADTARLTSKIAKPVGNIEKTLKYSPNLAIEGLQRVAETKPVQSLVNFAHNSPALNQLQTGIADFLGANPESRLLGTVGANKRAAKLLEQKNQIANINQRNAAINLNKQALGNITEKQGKQLIQAIERGEQVPENLKEARSILKEKVSANAEQYIASGNLDKQVVQDLPINQAASIRLNKPINELTDAEKLEELKIQSAKPKEQQPFYIPIMYDEKLKASDFFANTTKSYKAPELKQRKVGMDLSADTGAAQINIKDTRVKMRAIKKDIKLPEVTKGTYIRGRYKNRFFTKNITDDLTRDLIDADNALLEVTKEIKNNPANALQNMDILENKLTDKVGKLPDEAQQKYYDKFYKDLDIANTHEELRKKALTPEGAGFVADDVINSKQKVTKLSQSILKAKGLPTDIKKTIKQNAPTYESMTNNDLIMTASDAIDKDLMGNLADVMAKDKFNAFDVERTRQIAKRLNAQNTPEANETLINLLDKASEQASKSGQAVQAFSLWNNLTPEGAILKTNKLLNEYNKRFGKNLKLTQEQINNITKLQETAQALPDGYDKDVALAKSLKYQQSIIPKSLGSKIKAYRNISLLLNPKTLGRNVVGNALFNTLDTASKTLAVPVDRVMSVFTKTHTRALPQVGESLKGLKLGAERGFKEAMQGINTADVSSRYDLQGGKVFESKVGQAFETALDLGLRVPDRAFYNSVYAESLANQLKASGLKEPTTKMIKQAEQEALEGVFQNKSKLSDITLGLRQQFNRVGTKEFGLGDLLIPYAQTPANLAQQGINYSPLGLLKAGASLKGGNQRQASLDIARALVGTGIGAAGYNAVKSGQATGSLETGKGDRKS